MGEALRAGIATAVLGACLALIDGVAWAEETPPIDAPPVAQATPEAPSEPSLSWSVVGARLAERSFFVAGEMGYPFLPRFSALYGVDRRLSIGGAIGFDYGAHQTDIGFSPAFYLGVPIRLDLTLEGDIELALRFDPGLLLGGRTRTASVLAGATADVLKSPWPQIVIGGGLSVPLELAFGDVGTHFSFPLLIGGVGEWHPFPALAIFAEMRFGGHFDTHFGTSFGLRITTGVGYRF